MAVATIWLLFLFELCFPLPQEMAELARHHSEFEERGVSLLGLCVGSVSDHREFVKDIQDGFGVKVDYPVIADESREIVHRLGVVHPRMRGTADGRHSVRSIVVASPVSLGREVELIMHYPPHIGRATTELLRCVDALLRSAADHGIGTPGNWVAGEDVLILPSVSDAEARAKYGVSAPDDAAADADGGESGFSQLRPYLRLVADPGLPRTTTE
jgi:alkyl hydroperoxide reductase subunit AhpC